MAKYDYKEAVMADVEEYINDEIDMEAVKKEFDFDEFCDKLETELWITDSVTGNASGSYTFNRWQAEENLCHNMDLLEDACEEWGEDLGELVKRGAEVCDVTIRCYLLAECIQEVLERMWN